MDGREAALGAADRPGASRLAGPGHQRVVASLAVSAADRMDRRQIDDVEPHRRGALELGRGFREGGAPVDGRLGAREELVPRGEARPLAVDDDLELARGPGRLRPVEMATHQFAELGFDGARRGLRLGRGALDPIGAGDERRAVRALRALRRGQDQLRALPQRARQILVRRAALLQIREPRAEGIRERLDRVLISPVRLERELAGPAVVVDVAHRRLTPRALAGAAVPQVGGQHVVAVLEDVGGDFEDGADLALDGIASAVHRWRHGLDDDRAPRGVDGREGHDAVTLRD